MEARWPDLGRELSRYLEAHRDRLYLAADPIGIPGGERCKNDAGLLEDLYAKLYEFGVDRQSFVIVIGGEGATLMSGRNLLD